MTAQSHRRMLMSTATQSLPYTIAFDLDGTLAATGPDILRSLNAALTEGGLDPAPAERMNELVSLGRGPRFLIEHCFRLNGRDADGESVQKLADRYVEIYYENIAVDSALFPGCASSLEALRSRDFRLAVCTNKPERHAKSLLQALGILPLFSAVFGRDTLAYSKPDPRHLTGTVLAARGDPARAIMVGDSMTDVATARAAGIPVICVAFGYSDVPVATLGADMLIHSFDELPAAVGALARDSDSSAPLQQ